MSNDDEKRLVEKAQASHGRPIASNGTSGGIKPQAAKVEPLTRGAASHDRPKVDKPKKS